jgi:hypothetical protein
MTGGLNGLSRRGYLEAAGLVRWCWFNESDWRTFIGHIAPRQLQCFGQQAGCDVDVHRQHTA